MPIIFNQLDFKNFSISGLRNALFWGEKKGNQKYTHLLSCFAMRKSKVWQVIPAKPILRGKILCSMSHKGFLPPCARSTCRKVSLAQGGCSGCRRRPCAWTCFHKVTFRSAAVFENFCCSQKYWDGKHHTSVVLFPSKVTLGIYCPERGGRMSPGLGLKDSLLGLSTLPQGLNHLEFIDAQGVLPGTTCRSLYAQASRATTSPIGCSSHLYLTVWHLLGSPWLLETSLWAWQVWVST